VIVTPEATALAPPLAIAGPVSRHNRGFSSPSIRFRSADREYWEFRTLDRREHEEYWQWRHDHPDRDRDHQ